MPNIKINHGYKRPTWEANESFFDMCKRIGAKTANVTGMIGSGTKVHHLTVEYVDTDKGWGMLSVWSLCGSAKWNSTIKPVFSTDLEVTCTRCNANAYRSNDYNTNQTTTTNTKKETTMKKVTVKQIKTACQLINEKDGLRPANDRIMIGARATLAQCTKVFLTAIEEINIMGRLDNVPADAWDTYRLLVPKDSVTEAVKETVINYEDTPEGKAELAASRADAKAAKAVKAVKANAAKADGPKKVAAINKAVDTAIKKTKETTETNLKPKRYTKAVAFWECLNNTPVTTKPELAAALCKAHGNGSEAEAKFWTQNYLNLLVETGLVEVKNEAVTLIER